MTAAAVLEELGRRKIDLTSEGDRLRWRGPKGAFTPDLKSEITKLKPEILTLLNTTEANSCGAGCPSSGNAIRPLEEQNAEALELLGEMIDFYNERASVLEYDAGFPRDEAERLALIEVKASETFQKWQNLG